VTQPWARSGRFVPRTFVRPFLRFADREASSGIALIVAAAFGLIWANLNFDSYESFFATSIRFELGPLHLDETLRGFVNDGLMAIFFFVVGLEIKRELVVGDLREPRAALLPILAALGGMIVPALLYLALAGSAPGAERGWGVPMATDIAFAVGVLALVGKRVPVGAKLFLLTLAIADDIGAIAVIAIFYSGPLSIGWLVVAVAALVGVWGAGRVGIRSLGVYLPLALLAWLATLESGVHATLAGVALGLLTPASPFYALGEFRSQSGPILQKLVTEDDDVWERESADFSLLTIAEFARESVSPLTRIEPALSLWSAFVVVPIFALANGGINFGSGLVNLTSPIALGVGLGLLVGKAVGVSLFTLLGTASGLSLPSGMTRRHVFGVSILAGIGFTVALFIAGLAFDDRQHFVDARVGIFAASIAAALLGLAVLRFGGSRRAGV
jgi:NhaA family Na+:H+ antiporter